MLGEHRLRVELHALDGVLPMSDTHHLAGVRLGGDLQAVRHRLALDDQRVVATRLERAGQAGEDPLAVVVDHGGLAVHQPAGAHHLAPERFADGLVAQAHAQDRDAPGEVPDHLHREAGFLGRAWPRRDHDVRRRQPLHVFQCEGIVAPHLHLLPQFRQVLHQVVCERIVVVDNEYHYSPRSAISIARIRALALLTVSWYSRSGTESATMPAPACRCATPSLRTSVRIVIQVSMLPV